MSGADFTPDLDECGCCASDGAPQRIENPPGLPALKYRVGTYAQFRDRMLHAVATTRAQPNDPGSPRPLNRLTVRTADDATIALFDSVATVADILTFYQERIANEGYLRTATERRSVLELARSIGYELSPGVAAAAYLSFAVEDAPGAPGRCLVPQGTAIQSIPAQGKLPQVFETSAELVARAEWNAMRPRLTRPAEMAVMLDGTTRRIVLLVPADSVPPGPNVFPKVAETLLHRFDPDGAPAVPVDAVEVTRVYFTEAASGIAKGDLLLFAGGEGVDRITAIRRVAEVVAEPARKRLRADIEDLLAATQGEQVVKYAIPMVRAFTSVKIAKVQFNLSNISSSVTSKSWHERDLRVMLSVQSWSDRQLTQAVNTPAVAPAQPPQSGAFAFRERVGFFGNSAPRWSSLPSTNTNGAGTTGYIAAWDQADQPTSPPKPSNSRTIWESSQGVEHPGTGPHAYLERAVPGMVQGSWLIIDAPAPPAQAWTVHHAQEMSRADFAMSGKTTALTLGDPATGAPLTKTPTAELYRFREATAHVASRRLDLAGLPIEDEVAARSTAIELDLLVLGLSTGQPIVLTGERSDAPGVEAAEVALLADVVHTGGVTTLLLEDEIKYSYVREKLRICANVVHATHGETVREVLGSGDASRANQSFALSKPPLTYVSAATPRGSQSTLEIRVNGVRWEEEPSLYGLASNRQAYIVRIDDAARPRITFGDGVFGARTLSGPTNITARYRSGIGPDGEVDAGSLTLLRTMPLGLRGVTNSMPASGAEARERLADARTNAPRTVLTFERIVSLLDYEDFTRTFPGIGKALADVLWVDGASVIHLTVAGATGGAASADTLANLRKAIAAASDSSQRFAVSTFEPRYFTCEARIAVDPRYEFEAVQEAVGARVQGAFLFEERRLAQSVTAAEVLRTMHDVPGVIAADLQVLAPYSDEAASAGADASTTLVVAHRARWDSVTRTFQAAEMLLVNPAGILLEEMKP